MIILNVLDPPNHPFRPRALWRDFVAFCEPGGPEAELLAKRHSVPIQQGLQVYETDAAQLLLPVQPSNQVSLSKV